MLDRYLQFNLKDKPAGYLGSILVGVTFAVVWTPCVGPILGAILALAGTSAQIKRGILLRAAYAAGLALAVFLSTVAINCFFQFSRVFCRYLPAIHMTAGVLLVIVGILLLTDDITVLNIYAVHFTPEWLIEKTLVDCNNR